MERPRRKTNRLHTYILSRKIGDGLSPETAYRPEIADEVGNFCCVEIQGDRFLVCIEESELRRGTNDIDVSLSNMPSIRSSIGLAPDGEVSEDPEQLVYDLAVEVGAVRGGQSLALGSRIRK